MKISSGENGIANPSWKEPAALEHMCRFSFPRAKGPLIIFIFRSIKSRLRWRPQISSMFDSYPCGGLENKRFSCTPILVISVYPCLLVLT